MLVPDCFYFSEKFPTALAVSHVQKFFFVSIEAKPDEGHSLLSYWNERKTCLTQVHLDKHHKNTVCLVSYLSLSLNHLRTNNLIYI